MGFQSESKNLCTSLRNVYVEANEGRLIMARIKEGSASRALGFRRILKILRKMSIKNLQLKLQIANFNQILNFSEHLRNVSNFARKFGKHYILNVHAQQSVAAESLA